jgi:CRP-like cAMP-binding protein
MLLESRDLRILAVRFVGKVTAICTEEAVMAGSSTVADAFAATDLFGSLNKRTINRIADSAKTTNHGAGKEITTQGEEGVGFHLILSGAATVTVNGKAVSHLRPGDYFGEISLIDGKRRSATVITDAETTTAALSAWQFRPMLDEVPGLAKHLLLVLCERVRKAEANEIVLTT